MFTEPLNKGVEYTKFSRANSLLEKVRYQSVKLIENTTSRSIAERLVAGVEEKTVADVGAVID